MSSETLCEFATLLVKVFLNVTKETGPDNAQGYIFMRVLLMLFADKIHRLGVLLNSK